LKEGGINVRNKTTVIAFWITLLSAALIFNGMAIGQGKPPAKAAAPAKIELNKATPEQLSKCPGLTVALGKAIADYRTKSGPFKTPEDLLKVKGVTKEILNKLNPKIEKEIIYVTPAVSSSDDDEEEPSLKPSKC
jgi:competence ComEA-like helix-hairpin-helix protein